MAHNGKWSLPVRAGAVLIEISLQIDHGVYSPCKSMSNLPNHFENVLLGYAERVLLDNLAQTSVQYCLPCTWWLSSEMACRATESSQDQTLQDAVAAAAAEAAALAAEAAGREPSTRQEQGRDKTRVESRDRSKEEGREISREERRRRSPARSRRQQEDQTEQAEHSRKRRRWVPSLSSRHSS